MTGEIADAGSGGFISHLPKPWGNFAYKSAAAVEHHVSAVLIKGRKKNPESQPHQVSKHAQKIGNYY